LLRRRKRKEKRNAITLPARGRTARSSKEAPDGTGGTLVAVAARQGGEEGGVEGTAGEESGF